MKPLVSIITPAYNSEKFIHAAINSVLAQSYSHFEMWVVIDSGTTDSTAEIVLDYNKKDSRIKLLKITEGRGLALARNTAIEQSSGKFIAFLDSDDLWLPEKLSKQVALMENTQVAISCTGFRRISEDLNKTGHLQLPPTELRYETLLINNRMACLTVMIDQSQVGKIKFKETKHEDYLMWLSLLKKFGKGLGLTEDLARYRIVAQSRSANKFEMTKMRWKILREEENLSLPESLYYLSAYATTSLLKYAKF